MTNEEKFKTPEYRNEAFSRFCRSEAEEEKLIPCPHCGGDSIDIFETDFGKSEEPYQFAVKCCSCGALISAEDKDSAIAAWNRRVK